MATESTNQVRVMMWCPPRSLSTVFEKCMSYVDDVQIVNEPYNSAATNSPEVMEKLAGGSADIKDAVGKFVAAAEETQMSENLQGVGWDAKVCTHAWVKNLLEGQFPDKKVIFVKDLITGIQGQFHMIPKGYKHTFLIRNPTKTLISLRKNLVKMFPVPEGQSFSLLAMPPIIRDLYQPLVQLVEYVKENEGETKPIIIDADDLQNHPESIVRQYCEAVGIPYKESLLEWPAGDDCVKKTWLVGKQMLQGDQLYGYYAAAFGSTKFLPAKPLPSENEIPADVVEVANMQEPSYKQLYDIRIKP